MGFTFRPSNPAAVRASGFSRAAAVKALEGSGLSLAERPLGENGPLQPELPEDISSLSFAELRTLHGQCVQMASYVDEQATLAAVDATEEEANLVLVKARSRFQFAGTVADKDAKVANDPVFLAAEKSCIEAKAKAEVLLALRRKYERYAGLCSREQSAKEAEIYRLRG